MKNVLPKPWKELFDKHWNTPIRKRAKERLAANLGRLVFYCQPAGPKAKDASDVDALVKQLTLWPGADLLKSIEDAVLVLAVTERKFPERRIWKTFELVNRRMPKLRLAGCIHALVHRALERFLEALDSGPQKLSEVQHWSEPLVSWLLRIGYPLGADSLKTLNPAAALEAQHRQEKEKQKVREAKLAKFRQSGRRIKKTKEDFEDDRLMELVTNGDEKAFEKLCKRHKERIRQKLREIAGKKADLELLAATVFTKVRQAAPTYVPTAKVTTWLTTIAKNVAINEKKRASVEKKRIELEHITRTGSRGTRKTVTGDAEFYLGYAPESYGDDKAADDLADEVEDYFRLF